MHRERLWRNRAFTRLWAAHTISQFGTAISTLAIPLVAAITLDASPFHVGLLAAIEAVPLLVFGLFVGVWVDRYRRLPIMVAADILRAILLLGIPVGAYFDALTIGMLYALALLVGTLTVFFDVSAQAFTVSILRRDQLIEGNGRMQSSYAAAEVAGPGIAGGIVGIFGPPYAMVVNSVTFLVSAVFLRGIEVRERLSAGGTQRSILREMREGLSFVVHSVTLRTLGLSVALWNLFHRGRQAMLVVFMTRTLDLSATAIGLAFAMAGVGYFIGTLIPERAARRFGLGPTIVGSVLTCLPSGLLIAAAFGPPLLATTVVSVGLFAEGLGVTVYDINQYSLRQAVTPDHLRGRVSSALRVAIRCTVPLGALGAGLLAEWIGLRAVVALGALAAPCAALVVWLSPVRAVREMPATPVVGSTPTTEAASAAAAP